MSAGTVKPKLSAEEFTPQDLDCYNVVGLQPLRFNEVFSSGFSKAYENGKTTISMLVGYYGMGKTLVVRRQLMFSIRTYSFALPIYMPLRHIAKLDMREYSELAKTLKIREPSPITMALMCWYGRCKEFLGAFEWEQGESLNRVRRRRIDVLKDVIQQNPKSFYELIRIVTDQGFVSIIAIDETEALVLRDTRQSTVLLQREDGIGTLLIKEILKNLYSIIRLGLKGPAHIIIASALNFKTDDWIRIPLQELAMYPQDYSLEKLLTLLEVSDKDLRKVIEASSSEERLELVHQLINKYRGRLPFENPAIRQHLENIIVELRYTSDEYMFFIEKNLGLKVMLPILASLFEYMNMSFRTLVRISQELKRYNLNRLDYDALSQVFKSNVIKCYEVDTKLKQSKIIPKHAKWLTRTCRLIEEGIVVISKDIAPLVEGLDAQQRVELCKRILRKLCEALDISPDRCVWWDFSIVQSIKNKLDNIRLNWGAINLVIGRHGIEFYTIDEVLLRLMLGDPYDLIGNVVELYDYIRRLIEARRHRSARGMRS